MLMPGLQALKSKTNSSGGAPIGAKWII